ncbi:MAG: 2-amino-4-hydroxy-6-hydroxymethyldihydropteridine diphosphokinase [Gammaproteobacteria bacterium]
MPERDIYIAIGSNIEPERHVPAAITDLDAAYGPLVCSTLYRCAPVGFAGPDFINCVVRGKTDLPLAPLREHLKTMERLAGRDHSSRSAARELDLDLLLYGEEVIESEGFIVPRPDILDYAFVLRPLAEIAPEAMHPTTGRSFAWHWAHFEGEKVPLESVALV